jgi:hypothetical protein
MSLSSGVINSTPIHRIAPAIPKLIPKKCNIETVNHSNMSRLQRTIEEHMIDDKNSQINQINSEIKAHVLHEVGECTQKTTS